MNGLLHLRLHPSSVLSYTRLPQRALAHFSQHPFLHHCLLPHLLSAQHVTEHPAADLAWQHRQQLCQLCQKLGLQRLAIG